MTKTALVSGGAGFIGHTVVKYILDNTDWNVVCLVTFRHKGKSDRLNVALEGQDPSRVRILFHDLQGPISAQMDDEIGPVNYVLSLASDSHVDRSLVEPVEFMQRNVAIITNLAEWARKRDIEAFVHLSTDEVYGPAREGQSHHEWRDPIKPSNAYCVAPDTKILSQYGWVPIEDFDPTRDRLLSRPVSSKFGDAPRYMPRASSVPASRKWVKDYDGDMLTVTTHSGESITTTPEHHFMTFANSHASGGRKIVWKSAGELAVGDKVCVIQSIPEPRYATKFDSTHARWLGYFYADGSYDKKRNRYVTLADQKREYIDFYAQIAEDWFGASAKSSTPGKFGHIFKHGTKDCWYLQFASEAQRDSVDLSNKAGLLEYAKTWSNEAIANFLGGWIDGDGSVHRDDHRVKNATICDYTEGVNVAQWMLRRLGIRATIDLKNHRVIVSGSRDLQRLWALVPSLKFRDDDQFAKPQKAHGKAQGFDVDRITSITAEHYTGKVYDLEVLANGGHNYVADYFVVHNSASKAAQEAYLFSCWRAFDLPLILLNLMNQIGETQDPEKFVPRVLAAAVNGTELTIHAAPDGTVGTRMYMHPRCLASAMLFAIEFCTARLNFQLHWPDSGDPNSTIETLRYSQGGELPYRFHVAGTEISNDTLALKVAEYAGHPLKYKTVDAQTSRPGHDLRYALDDSKIRRLGWKPPMDLDEAIKETVEWTMAHPEWLL